MRRSPLLALAVLGALARVASAADPNETVNQSEQVLAELVAIPGKQIPAKLLNEAQGVAIIPRVIKIGFVAGGRRGHGVVLVRDAEGAWGLPRFITLTGGSVGWQAGVSGTDVVLVFRTRRSVENLLKGKFTIGVDAAAAAGPVGRNAAAATDATLQAEILSYSRSRGLFLGASIDGSAIELDGAANAAYYQSPDPENPQVIPASATQLQAYVAELAVGSALQPVVAGAAMQAPVAVGAARFVGETRRPPQRTRSGIDAPHTAARSPVASLPSTAGRHHRSRRAAEPGGARRRRCAIRESRRRPGVRGPQLAARIPVHARAAAGIRRGRRRAKRHAAIARPAGRQ